MSSHKFTKYSSIENHYYRGYLDKVREVVGFKDDLQWIVTEKVHGCNLSFIVSDDEKVAVAGRNSILDKKSPLHPEAVRYVTKKYSNCAVKLFEYISEMKGPDVSQVTIFGELFGGSYPLGGPQTVKRKPIFSEVLYTNNYDFYAFDILVLFKDESTIWLSPDVLDDVLPKSGFTVYAKPLFKGSFEDAIKFDTIFSSTLPSLFYNHPPLTRKHSEKDPVINIVEGVVIKPCSNLVMSDGDRVIIKKKNEKFLEVAKAVKLTNKEKQNEDDVLESKTKLWYDLKRYITLNRMNNVISKMGNLDRQSLANAFEVDVMEEFNKTNQENWNKVDAASKSLISKKIKKAGFEFVQEIKTTK